MSVATVRAIFGLVDEIMRELVGKSGALDVGHGANPEEALKAPRQLHGI